jgi:hypothetical protein
MTRTVWPQTVFIALVSADITSLMLLRGDLRDLVVSESRLVLGLKRA